MKFLVVASDVIYPAGAMRDYEGKFYLPFKGGFTKPIYAIPAIMTGSMRSRDSSPISCDRRQSGPPGRPGCRRSPARSYRRRTPEETFVAEADELRREYQVRTGFQGAPFFEIHAERFALIAADRASGGGWMLQHAWFVSALERARGKFVMVLLGHPLFAGGHAQAAGVPAFSEIHELLRQHRVPLVMAGDTHDFEQHYREVYDGPAGPTEMHHIVNGGGGAYLSIGTALDSGPCGPLLPTGPSTPSTAAFCKARHGDAAVENGLCGGG